MSYINSHVLIRSSRLCAKYMRNTVNILIIKYIFNKYIYIISNYLNLILVIYVFI